MMPRHEAPSLGMEKMGKTDYSTLLFTLLVGAVIGWYAKAEEDRKDLNYVGYIKQCMRTNPATSKPFDICPSLSEVEREAILLGSERCLKAFPLADRRAPIACHPADSSGWRL